MSVNAPFVQELEQEAQATRRVLERVPAGQLGWKPHEKSMSLGQLALHVASLPGNVSEILREAADLIAKKLGMHPEPDPDLNLMDQDAIDALEVSEIELGALMIDLEDEIEEIRSAFTGG